MRLKSLALCVLVLAVFSAAVYFLRRPGPPLSTDARLNQSLVQRAAVEQAAKVRISDQGKTVVLVRQPDRTWRVPSYYDFPADFSKLSALVQSLTDAKLQRLVTTNPERIARLDFKDTAIALLDAADKELWSVTLGKAPDAGDGRFVRFGQEPKAYLADFNGWIDADAKSWAEAQLPGFAADSIAKIEIPLAEGEPVTVSRAKKEDHWTADKTPANQQLKVDRISSLLSSLGSLRFNDTNDLADPNVVAAKANLRTYTFTTFDHKTITVALGRKPEEKKPKPAAPAPALAASAPANPAKSAAVNPAAAAKPPAPEYETIPAGPVFAFIHHSDAAATINAMMAQRAFQISDYVFTGLPQKSDELFEPATPPPVPPPAANPPTKK